MMLSNKSDVTSEMIRESINAMDKIVLEDKKLPNLPTPEEIQIHSRISSMAMSSDQTLQIIYKLYGDKYFK